MNSQGVVLYRDMLQFNVFKVRIHIDLFETSTPTREDRLSNSQPDQDLPDAMLENMERSSYPRFLLPTVSLCI